MVLSLLQPQTYLTSDVAGPPCVTSGDENWAIASPCSGHVVARFHDRTVSRNRSLGSSGIVDDLANGWRAHRVSSDRDHAAAGIARHLCPHRGHSHLND